MPIARKELIDLEATSYYHCYNRCVRKGYLFGTDKDTKKNYDHRKEWVLEHLRYLSAGFAIDVASYAIMSNHYHIVIHVNKALALSWSDEEVNERWKHALGRKKPFDSSTPEEMNQRRENLYSISWYMSCLNEHIARLANKEDEVTGKFWESRFQSQALVDEGALLACMTYVDLNPIRAKMADTLDGSDFTSIQERLQTYKNNQFTPDTLMDFQSPEAEADTKTETHEAKTNTLKASLPFSVTDYFALVDWTGRQFREGKPGYMAADVPPIVKETNLNPAYWVSTVEQSSIRDQPILGTLTQMKAWAKKIGKDWLKGQKITILKYLST